MIDLDTLQYQVLHDLIKITENSDRIFACENEEN